MSEVKSGSDREEEILRDWCNRLVAALHVEELDVDVATVLAVTGEAARMVLRPAGPLTTFIAGYAAGHAVGAGRASVEKATNEALRTASQACRSEHTTTNDA